MVSLINISEVYGKKRKIKRETDLRLKIMKIINDTYKGSVRYVVGQTEGVCSQAIELLVEGDIILDAAFHLSLIHI